MTVQGPGISSFRQIKERLVHFQSYADAKMTQLHLETTTLLDREF